MECYQYCVYGPRMAVAGFKCIEDAIIYANFKLTAGECVKVVDMADHQVVIDYIHSQILP